MKLAFVIWAFTMTAFAVLYSAGRISEDVFAVLIMVYALALPLGIKLEAIHRDITKR